MTPIEQAAHLLRERARSYARDVARLHGTEDTDPGDVAVLATLRDELYRVADVIETTT